MKSYIISLKLVKSYFRQALYSKVCDPLVVELMICLTFSCFSFDRQLLVNSKSLLTKTASCKSFSKSSRFSIVLTSRIEF